MGAVGDGVDQVCSGLKQSHGSGRKPNKTKPNQMSHIQAMVHLLHPWRTGSVLPCTADGGEGGAGMEE